ncbi:MAG: hypothetical protein GXP49_09390 [Deltaproteobacteria bacterium]|nr:hypothetical protein [Deltaproteobacteria bacterium]
MSNKNEITLTASLAAGLLILFYGLGCGNDYSNGYWHDPRDDSSFQDWQEPVEQAKPKVVSNLCKTACSEVEQCWDNDSRLADTEKQMTKFPIPKGRCEELCSNGLLKNFVWTCLGNTLQKESNPKYCENKDLCFSD